MSEEEVLVGSWTSYEVDMKDHLRERIPAALAFVLIVTMVLVWFQVHSVLVPIKAVFMNILNNRFLRTDCCCIPRWPLGRPTELHTTTTRSDGPPTGVRNRFRTLYGLRSLDALQNS